jgi:low temperature requirement protein LtrA
MARLAFGRSLLRSDVDEDVSRVTFFELFFDLVFVYAVTEVTLIVLKEPSWVHLLQASLIAVVVWWVWVFTAWVTNWLHPDRGPVRGMLIVLMGLGLLWATAIPGAFGERAPLFAIILVVMNVGRSAFTIVAFAELRDHALNFLRITCWHLFSAPFWIVGAFVDDRVRVALWVIAFLIDLAGPRAFFWVPRLGRSGLDTWDITGEHMAERVSLFLIIALGESIIETGQGVAAHGVDVPIVTAFLAAFAGSVLLWFLYFNHAQHHASHYIGEAEDTGMVAQTAYTYTPVLMTLGIIVTAIGDGLSLDQPWGRGDAFAAAMLSIGPTLYLLGNALFKRFTGGPWLASHLIGGVLFGGLFLLNPWLPITLLSWVGNLVLLLVVFADDVQYRRKGAPEEGEGGEHEQPDSLET